MLDFWIGRWNVLAEDGALLGTDVVAPAVRGEAVLEHWRGAGGDEGESLFYRDPSTGIWRQVWVQAGCVKEKRHDLEWRDGVRFAGHAYVGDRVLADRTTLTPLPGGRVRQVIEQSRDGVDWRVGFDAVYVRD